MPTSKIVWIKTNHRGLRYYEHPTRLHGKRKDRYYSIRFKVDGKEHGYGIGWVSDGMPEEIRNQERDIGFEEYCLKLLRQYKGNLKAGSGPRSPKEQRRIEEERREQEAAEAERLEKEAVNFDTFFTEIYIPLARSSKKLTSTKREEGLYLIWIKSVIGDMALKNITPFNIEKLKTHMAAKGQSARSIEYALAVVRQVFNTAHRLGIYRGDSPMEGIKAPKIDNGRMRFLTKAEATALLKLLKERSNDVHDMALLSLHAGLRFGEIVSLRWGDVDNNKRILTIRDAKAGSRYAFLTGQATDMLRGREQGKRSDHVFPGRKGQVNSLSSAFDKAVYDLKLNEGIDDPRLRVVFHTCRHTYASWMIEEGVDLYTLQKLLGHKTSVMTQRYAHLSENKLRDAAAALGAACQKDQKPEQPISLVK